MAEALRIAIVGAESTGKTTLAAALASAIAQGVAGVQGLRVAWVGEALRDWCASAGRTPLAHEQSALLAEQHARIDAAAARHDVVVCDTTGLMTAVYSRIVFADESLDALALCRHRQMALTLLTALDLPWVADGHQRDGPQVREPVDTLLRQRLLAGRLPFAVIGGAGAVRTGQALAAVTPLLRGRHAQTPPAPIGPALDGGATPGQRRWTCQCCLPDLADAKGRLPKA